MNGRTKTPPFVMLNHYVFDCTAYRSLAIGPRSLLWELIRRFNGSNNGKIGLGVREAAQQMNVTKDTTARYFQVLAESGFIALGRAGGFNMKDPSSRRASEWRLTWEWFNDQPPSKEFMAKAKQSAVQIVDTLGPENPDTAAKDARECPND